MFNKPVDVLCTAGNPRERRTVYDYFKNIDVRLFTVGRLDYKTSGLIIVTNDGEFANHISHPRYNCAKEYSVKINNMITDDDIKRLEKGMELEDYNTSLAEVNLIKRNKNISTFNIIIHEGKNRQIRNMIRELGYRVLKLERIRIGELNNDGIKTGEYRKLDKKEIESLYNKKII